MSDPRRADLPRHERDVSWQRWEMGSLHQPRPSSAPDSTLPSPEETAKRKAAFKRQAELRLLREKVMEEAREIGYREGWEAGHAAGYEAGFTEGAEQGHKQARQKQERLTKETLAPLKPLAEHFSQALEELDAALGDALVDLAMATGRQLACDALQADPKQVLALVHALLHTEPAMSGKPCLWLHPQDRALVEEHLGSELAAAGWRLQPDEQISRGGCRVTSESGEFDATWESRWEAAQRQVRHRAPPSDDKPST